MVVHFVGPIPPPTNGQSVSTGVMLGALLQSYSDVKVYDTGGSARSIIRIIKNILPVIMIMRGGELCYISVNSNIGMWLSAVSALAGRLCCTRIMLHHHAYEHVRRRKLSMAALSRFAGPRAVHIVLSDRMRNEIQSTNPEVRRVKVLNNAGFISDPAYVARLDTPQKITIGHLSNLTEEKGIGVVIETAMALIEAGHDIRLLVAGPANDRYAQDAIARGKIQLGAAFQYVGPIYGVQKAAFFRKIDLFIFPSRYQNEAAPLVILESLAAGTPCIAFDIGCIAEQIGRGGGKTVDLRANFASETLQYVAGLNRSESRLQARQRFLKLLHDYEMQLSEIIADRRE